MRMRVPIAVSVGGCRSGDICGSRNEVGGRTMVVMPDVLIGMDGHYVILLMEVVQEMIFRGGCERSRHNEHWRLCGQQDNWMTVHIQLLLKTHRWQV